MKKEIIEKEAEADKNLRSKINQVGNIVHESVVDSQDEENNELVRTWTPENYKNQNKLLQLLVHQPNYLIMKYC